MLKSSTLLLLLCLPAACAKRAPTTVADAPAPVTAAASADSAAAPAGKFVPPRLVSSVPLAIKFRTVTRGGRGMPPAPPARIDFTYEVVIDTIGRAKMGTLVVRGTHAADVRDSVVEWLRRSRFAPATLDGVPVEGLFRMR